VTFYKNLVFGESLSFTGLSQWLSVQLYQAASIDSAAGFGFARSQPKSKAKASKAKGARKRAKSPCKSPRETKKVKEKDFEKELKELSSECEETMQKLEQLHPKALWNRTLTDREIGSRMQKASSLFSRLSQMETLHSADVGGLKSQLEQQLRSIESNKALVGQLQSWGGDLQEEFLRSSAFTRLFSNLDNTMQQTILMHIGTKLLEALGIVAVFFFIS
jgi:hypothetical protein